MSTEKITYSLIFSRALGHAIKECEMKDKEAAEILGVKPPMVTKMKSGKTNVGIDTAARIARTFGYELTDFLILGRSILDGESHSGHRPPVVMPGQHSKDDVIAAKDQVIAAQQETIEQLKARLLEDNGAGAAAERWRTTLAPDADTTEK